MRTPTSLLLVLALSSAAPALTNAQGPMHRAMGRVPVTISVTLPAAKPALSTRGLLVQTGAGILGGIAATLPVVYMSMGSETDEPLLLAAVGVAYTAGTTAGIHYAGRAQGMSASPWATAGGVVGGLVVSGALMQPFMDDEGNVDGPAPLLVFVLPSVGGTAGYAVTRRVR